MILLLKIFLAVRAEAVRRTFTEMSQDYSLMQPDKLKSPLSWQTHLTASARSGALLRLLVALAFRGPVPVGVVDALTLVSLVSDLRLVLSPASEPAPNEPTEPGPAEPVPSADLPPQPLFKKLAPSGRRGEHRRVRKYGGRIESYGEIHLYSHSLIT